MMHYQSTHLTVINADVPASDCARNVDENGERQKTERSEKPQLS